MYGQTTFKFACSGMHITQSILFIPQIIFKLLNKICWQLHQWHLHCVPSPLNIKNPAYCHSCIYTFCRILRTKTYSLEDSSLLGCWNVSTSKQLPTLKGKHFIFTIKNLLRTTSEWRQRSVSIYQATLHNIIEYLNLHRCLSKNLKPRDDSLLKQH